MFMDFVQFAANFAILAILLRLLQGWLTQRNSEWANVLAFIY